MNSKEVSIPMNDIPLVVAVINKDGDVLFWNKYILENDAFSKLKSTNINDCLKNFIKNNEFFQKVEFVIEEKPFTVSMKKSNLNNGMIVVFINSDIETQLKSITTKQTTFISNLSHEIRTPLNGILGSLSLLLETKLDAAQYNYIELLKESSESLIRVVNDILDYSRLEAGMIYLDSKPFKVRTCFDEIHEILKSETQNKNIKVTLNIDRSLPDIIVSDKKRIQQVLINLYQNIIKVSKNGGFIHTKIYYKDDYLHFTIDDNSKGLDSISSKLLLFNGYGDTQEEGDKLNLSISNKLIKLFGGDVSIVSNSNKGTSIEFKIKIDIDRSEGNKNFLENKLIGIYDKDYQSRNLLFTSVLENKGVPVVFAIENDIIPIMKQKDFQSVFFSYDNENLDLLEKITLKIDKKSIILLIDDLTKIKFDELNDYSFDQIIQRPVQKAELIKKLYKLFETKKPYEIIYQDHHELGNLKVLVAEQVYINQRIIYDLLSKLGFKKIKIVSDGKEAIKYIQQNQGINLAFINLKLPQITGQKILEFIKSSLENVYTVALTSSPGDVSDFDDNIIIPFDINTLEAKIQKYLTKQK